MSLPWTIRDFFWRKVQKCISYRPRTTEYIVPTNQYTVWLLDDADNKKSLVIWTTVYCQNPCLCKSKYSVSVISASITLFLFDTYICTVYVTFDQVTLNSAFDYNSQVLVFIHASANDAFVRAYDCDIH